MCEMMFNGFIVETWRRDTSALDLPGAENFYITTYIVNIGFPLL